ncbi:MAG: AAA family ATPase [Patescibacteria group bacterium]|nr:AAA family ATPase [Patescibacteria group bacterium]
MKKNFPRYLLDLLKSFKEASFNLIIFFPYFFSIPTLFKTLFHPWKNLRSKKTTPGFTFSEFFDQLLFNFISRSIGFVMRLSIIFFYFLIHSLTVIAIPFFLISLVALSPILYFIYLIRKTPEEEKRLLKDDFVKKRCLAPENIPLVEQWFETFYQNHLVKKKWWSQDNLMTVPPLARDWSYGYTPTLDQYAVDLASPSYLYDINNIIDREKEINQIEVHLSKNKAANVLIVGEEGVGKKTIIDALAKKIYLGKTTINLMYKRILKIDMEKINNQMTLFESLLQEAIDAENIILFIDNFEKYLNWEVSLKKYAGSDKIQIIAVTTPFFYQKFIFPNEAINNLFSKVDVFEISKEEAMKILLEKFFELENYHRVIISFEAIKSAIEKSEYYITHIPFPEKTVDILDTACVYVKNRRKDKDQRPTVRPEDIGKVIYDKTHIPVTLSSQMKEKLLSLELLLKDEIIDQDEAINKLSAAIRRAFLLIGKRKKPLASFLFLGPTGVGKTQTAKAIAKVFFSSTSAQEEASLNPTRYLIRFDMSNYQSRYDIPKLIGDPSTNEPGLLTQAIRNQPYGVLLLDELEKADLKLINIFLTITDEGYFTDGRGEKVDCKNLVIIATSNAKDESFFPPEFLNRFDGVINFKKLSPESVKIIAKKIINNLEKEIFSLYNVRVKVKEETLENLIRMSYNPEYGARDMERLIRFEIEDKIAKIILANKDQPLIVI